MAIRATAVHGFGVMVAQKRSTPDRMSPVPFQSRGGASGVIVRYGYIVAEWGEPMRPDMTFSVTKSFLSTVVGLGTTAGSSIASRIPASR
jgi:hypothetical protein